MQARRASRELALILFSQFEKEISHYSHEDFENIMIKSVRILADNASEELKLTLGSLIDIKGFLEDYEAEHESNLSRPIGAKNKPVQIPLTSEMIEKTDAMIDVAEKAVMALEIAEFAELQIHIQRADAFLPGDLMDVLSFIAFIARADISDLNIRKTESEEHGRCLHQGGQLDFCGGFLPFLRAHALIPGGEDDRDDRYAEAFVVDIEHDVYALGPHLIHHAEQLLLRAEGSPPDEDCVGILQLQIGSL